MRLSFLSFALLWLARPAAADWKDGLPFNEAVPAELSSRPLRPQLDRIQRYFLPGTGRQLQLPTPLYLDYDSLEVFRLSVMDLSKPAPASLGNFTKYDGRRDAFLELDLRTDWQRENLSGKVKRRLDYYPGGVIVQSEVDYDDMGRRTFEMLFDKASVKLFERRYQYDGPGTVPLALAVVDGNGATQEAVNWVLDLHGLPLDEDHVDFQGLPVLHRSYRYDGELRLAHFLETPGADLRGLGMDFTYDSKGRLVERRVVSPDPLAPVWVTQFDVDWESGRMLERRELQDNMPLGKIIRNRTNYDPRFSLKYRWNFEGSLAALYLKPKDGDGGEGFPFQTRRYSLNAGGWLDESELLDRNGESLSRQFWQWDSQGDLTRHNRWGGSKGMSARNFEYDYDNQGNWTSRKADNQDEAVERKFEYYGD